VSSHLSSHALDSALLDGQGRKRLKQSELKFPMKYLQKAILKKKKLYFYPHCTAREGTYLKNYFLVKRFVGFSSPTTSDLNV
jgi:hypothetical protein